MSTDIRNKLDQAKDELYELKNAYENVNGGISWRNKQQNFSDFMTEVADFLNDDIETVYYAMDDAVDEIERLDEENDDLRAEVDRLNERISEMESAESND